MPNWTQNIVKIFVPADSAGLIQPIVRALANRSIDADAPEDDDARQSTPGQWLDFERLLPLPAVFLELGWEHGDTQAASIASGNWPRYLKLPEGEDVPVGRDAMVEMAERLRPGSRAAIEYYERCLAQTGVAEQIDWQTSRWGTKWNTSDEMLPPRILKADDYDGYWDFEGSTILSYEFSTAWSLPEGYAAELRRWCAEHGLGMRWWYSHEDGGTALNPRTDEIETVWSEETDLELQIEELSLVDRAALVSQGVRTEPRADLPAMTEVDPVTRAMRQAMA